MAAPASSPGIEATLHRCRPFQDGAATLVCTSCFKLLAFPHDARRVECGHCGVVTDGVAVNCTACRAQVRVPFGGGEHRCTRCGYGFRPMATLRIAKPAWVDEDGVAKGRLELRFTVLIDESVFARERRHDFAVVPSQPLRTAAVVWEEVMGAEFRAVGFYHEGMRLDSLLSPMQLRLPEGAEIVVRRAEQSTATGHDFLPSQFMQPTNCALCKEFIWGVFHQGKRCARCALPVHHRCAEKLTSICEAQRRHRFGIVNFADSDDEADASELTPVVGVVVGDDERVAFASCVTEAPELESDPAAMDVLSKMSCFSDEDITAMWLRYDVDGSGELNRAEVKTLVRDLVGAGGGMWEPEGVASPLLRSARVSQEAVVDRLLTRMDTNNDGAVQWDEFWYFFKAQQDAQFLSSVASSVDKLTIEVLYEVWNHYHVDGSGELETDELLALLGDLQATAGSRYETARKHRQRLASLLSPGATAVTWDVFYRTIVPAMKALLLKKE